MTYRELIEQLEKLTEEQLDCRVTVEDLYLQECFAGDLAITGNGHDSLGEDHPIITFLDRIEMSDDKDKEAKERLKAWKALPEEGRISWEGFKRQWQQRKASK